MMARAALIAVLTLVALAPRFDAAASIPARIDSFQADVTIDREGGVTVVERIAVVDDGDEIRSGIVRVVPTGLEHRPTAERRAAFRIGGATIDGAPAPYLLLFERDGARIVVGDPYRPLGPGAHVIELTYALEGAMNLADPSADELFWNATSEAPWVTLSARTTFRFPEPIAPRSTRAFLGRVGSTDESAVRIAVPEPGLVTFDAARPLSPGEVMSVAAAWPPGIIVRPSLLEGLAAWSSRNAVFLVAFAGLALLLALRFLPWPRILAGEDPSAIPLFEPPEGMDAATARRLYAGEFDDVAFAAALVDMAARDAIDIAPAGRGFRLEATGRGLDSLSPGEREAYGALFKDRRVVMLTDEADAGVQEAARRLGKAVDTASAGSRRLAPWPVLGALAIAVTTSVFAFRWAESTLEADDAAVRVALALGSTSLALLGWAYALAGGPSHGAMPRTAAAALGYVPIALFLLIWAWLLPSADAGFALVATCCLGVLVLEIVPLGIALTPEGRAKRRDLLGFRMYLETAEQERLAVLNPPKLTPERFERFLPFAYALGVEGAWMRRFAAEVGALDPEAADAARRTMQAHWRLALRSVSRLRVGDFDALARSSFRSGSIRSHGRSAFGGGGFAGGGRGGGRVGGW